MYIFERERVLARARAAPTRRGLEVVPHRRDVHRLPEGVHDDDHVVVLEEAVVRDARHELPVDVQSDRRRQSQLGQARRVQLAVRSRPTCQRTRKKGRPVGFGVKTKRVRCVLRFIRSTSLKARSHRTTSNSLSLFQGNSAFFFFNLQTPAVAQLDRHAAVAVANNNCGPSEGRAQVVILGPTALLRVYHERQYEGVYSSCRSGEREKKSSLYFVPFRRLPCRARVQNHAVAKEKQVSR